MGERQLPWEIRAAAAYFLAYAVLAVVHLLFQLTHNNIHFDASLLGFAIAPGLRARINGWRICGIVVISGGFALVVLFSPLLLQASNAEFYWSVLGFRVDSPPGVLIPLFVLIGAAEFAASVWVLWTLWRPETREFFTSNEPPPPQS